MPNFVVSALPKYVQTNKDLLIKNFALVGNGTRSRISIQTGVKKDAAINLLNLAPTLQDGAGCGFSAQGAATLSQRVIETAAIKVNMDFCEKTLLGKYAEYLVRVGATDNSFPFEAYVLEGVTNEINKAIEKLIWQGNKTKSTDATIKWIDGFIKVATDASVAGAAANTATTAYDAILAIYNALPEEVLDRGAEIYVSPAIFRKFMQEMVAKNFYHYNPGNEELGEFMLPGSDAKVVRTQGLAGVKTILGTFASNLVYGCDVEGDTTDIDVWWSQDDRVFKLAAEWNSGVQIAFPDMAIMDTFASL